MGWYRSVSRAASGKPSLPEASNTNFVESTQRLWRNRGLDVSDDITNVLADFLAQTPHNYDVLNGPDNLDSIRHVWVKSVTAVGERMEIWKI